MYLTRNMRARGPLNYLNREMHAGDEFQATDIDAQYLARHGRADDLGPNNDAMADFITGKTDAKPPPAVVDVPAAETPTSTDVDPEATNAPSSGKTVDQLKAALAEAGIDIPDGVTKKADLAALLDAGKQV